MGLPVVLLAFSVTMTLVTVDVLLTRLGKGDPARRSSTESRAIWSTKLWAAGVGGGAALTLGALLALGITRPVRRMVRQLRGSLPEDVADPGPSGEVNELSHLANTLNHLLLSFDKYVRTADIVRRLPDAILTIGPRGEIRSANPEAVRLLGLASDGGAGQALEEALGAGSDATRILEAIDRVRVGAGAEILRPAVLHRGAGAAVEVEATAVGTPGERGLEVVLTLKDLARVQAIRAEMRRVDQLAAVGGAVAAIAHEIAGPLQSIGTLVDLLRDDAEPGSAQRLYLDKVRATVDQLHRVTDEIRTLTQVDVRELAPCALNTLAGDALWLVEARFRDKAVKVSRDIPATMPAVRGDALRLGRALENLITNAFEAVPPGGEVRVTVAVEGSAPAGSATARVWNAGSYIPEAERQRIFSLFYTTKTRGSGLGLPIAYRTIVDHGGRIEVRSIPDAGTEFAVILPLLPEAA